MSRIINNILIRDLSDNDRTALSFAMSETGCFQASKAVMKSLHSFKRSIEVIRKQNARITELEHENKILRENAYKILTSAINLEKVLELSKTANSKRKYNY